MHNKYRHRGSNNKNGGRSVSKMAENGLPPEAVPPDINYRCHPNKVNSTVICILCNNVYHKSDFSRILEKKKKQILQDT